MNRLLALVAGFVVLASSVFAAGAAAGDPLTASVTAFYDVGGTPATIPFSYTYDFGDGTTWACTGDHIILSATESKDVETCTITGDTGGYPTGTFDVVPWLSDYFLSLDPPQEVEATSGTITLSAVAAAAAPAANGIFLCYSVYQDQPGVWPEQDAKALLSKGYWYPYAVAGKVDGGTNIGSHHLTCNIAATQSVSTSFLGGDGTVLGGAYAGAFGIYPVVGA